MMFDCITRIVGPVGAPTLPDAPPPTADRTPTRPAREPAPRCRADPLPCSGGDDRPHDRTASRNGANDAVTITTLVDAPDRKATSAANPETTPATPTTAAAPRSAIDPLIGSPSVVDRDAAVYPFRRTRPGPSRACVNRTSSMGCSASVRSQNPGGVESASPIYWACGPSRSSRPHVELDGGWVWSATARPARRPPPRRPRRSRCPPDRGGQRERCGRTPTRIRREAPRDVKVLRTASASRYIDTPSHDTNTARRLADRRVRARKPCHDGESTGPARRGPRCLRRRDVPRHASTPGRSTCHTGTTAAHATPTCRDPRPAPRTSGCRTHEATFGVSAAAAADTHRLPHFGGVGEMEVERGRAAGGLAEQARGVVDDQMRGRVHDRVGGSGGADMRAEGLGVTGVFTSTKYRNRRAIAGRRAARRLETAEGRRIRTNPAHPSGWSTQRGRSSTAVVRLSTHPGSRTRRDSSVISPRSPATSTSPT